MERLDLLAFCAAEGLTTWVHAPKDDPYHRRRWREAYPGAEAEQLAALAAAAAQAGVEFVYAIAPGLSINYTSEAELEALVAKCEQARGLGAARVELLWDDIEHELPHPGDAERYGAAESPSGAAQADLTNRFLAAFPQESLVVCPMGYAGTESTPYRRSFGGALDPGILVYWTGPEVVSRAIAAEEADAAAHALGHELVVWDNYPVNDFAAELLFLGPLRGRDPRLADCVAGVVANPMPRAVPSKLALATVADWLRDPAAYDPLASFERALAAYAAEVVEALRRLAPDPAEVQRPQDVAELAAALRFGVTAPVALALLEPYA